MKSRPAHASGDQQDQRRGFQRPGERKHFGDIYEQLLNDLQSAGNAGELLHPRAVTAFMVDRIDPRPGEPCSIRLRHWWLSHLCHPPHARPLCQKGGRRAGHAGGLHAVEKKQLPHMLCVHQHVAARASKTPAFVRHDNTLARPYISHSQADRMDSSLPTRPLWPGRGRYREQLPRHFQTRENRRPVSGPDHSPAQTGRPRCRGAARGSLFGEGVKTRLKEHLLEECNLHTIVRLPNSVFKPYASIGTNLLFFEKGQPTREVCSMSIACPPPEGLLMTRPIRIEHLQGCIDWWAGRSARAPGN